jgi:tRNA threonylcarbamoyladenosine biosynthesis protein TsaB
MVDRLLAECGIAAGDLGGLAVSVGPGSFTGLRVGIATAQGLGLGLGLPVAPVPTLDALAAVLPFAGAPVVPLLDARKGEVYLSLYRWTGQGMSREWDYLALAPGEAAGRLPAPVIVLGDGVAPCLPYLRARPGPIDVAPGTHAMPWAAVVGDLGRRRLESGGGVEPDALMPLYVRPSQAASPGRHG